MLIFVYIGLYWLLIGQLFDHFGGLFYQKTDLPPKSNNYCGNMTVVSILNFDIFKISGPLWPPRARPGPRSRISVRISSKNIKHL